MTVGATRFDASAIANPDRTSSHHRARWIWGYDKVSDFRNHMTSAESGGQIHAFFDFASCSSWRTERGRRGALQQPASVNAHGALASVQITPSVLANGKPLPTGVRAMKRHAHDGHADAWLQELEREVPD